MFFFVANTPCKYVDSKSKKLSLRLWRECIIDQAYIYCTIDYLALSKLVSKHWVERSRIGTFVRFVRACVYILPFLGVQPVFICRVTLFLKWQDNPIFTISHFQSLGKR